MRLTRRNCLMTLSGLPLAGLPLGGLALNASAARADLSSNPYVALVIGSGAYGGGQDLPNATQDSALMADRLHQLGYDVVHLTDPGRRKILRTLAAMRLVATTAKQVVIYLAGHGYAQAGTAVYLPSGAINGPSDQQGISLTTFARAFSKRPSHKIILFDACRTPPDFAPPHNAGPMSAMPAGLAIAYAAALGGAAYDGGQGTSPFAQALLRHLTDTAPPLDQLLRRVRLEVIRNTYGAQVPWLSSSLLQEVHLQIPPAH